MELTAGQGTVIGSTFEEMALLLRRIPAKLRKRVGVCLDTAHVFAAGYDLVKDYDGVWSRFDDVLGIARLGLLHLNDSKAPLGSKKDRHELIGKGAIGAGCVQADHERPAAGGASPRCSRRRRASDMVTNDRRALKLLRGFVGRR